MDKPAPAGETFGSLPLAARQDPEVRRRLSGPALRTFFNVARAWRLTTAEARALLGWPAPSTFHKYKAGEYGPLPYDTLTRLSLVLGIYKSLQLLYPEPQFADRWIRMPNSNALFGGAAPMDFLVDGGIDALFQLRRLLDGRRG
ncbi:MAG TPA: antitoxin Xre-like helix-turn-helix domain-containing protein [Vicinamibacterales bacterium]|nr:antitoxin Xre-like helix-turn-helix domain-containing protein [Vicinamibacterales bacterium]